MVIDHMNAIWFGEAFFPLHLLGRASFPLFCYAVAAAVMKKDAGGAGRYAAKLLVLGALVQPFYQLALGLETGNVVFTLAAGAALAAFSSRVRPWQIYALYIVAALSMLLPTALEFGLAGIMLPSAIVLALRGQRSVYPFLILLLFSANMGGLLETLRQGMGGNVWIAYSAVGLASTLLPWLVLSIAKDLKPSGRYLPKYALHVFYPAHLLLLKALGLAFFT
ncbi:MAG: conjugal transfer protein TraX [Alphaproteobacteria bacterium]|nr:conjugal transfer protein TraX [Alphaproteobacteria bacterium]